MLGQWVRRGTVVLACACLLALGPVAVAGAGLATFSNVVPAGGSTSTVSLMMTLDGSVVPASFETSTGILSYAPAGPLAEGTHTVVITALDAEGFSSWNAWSFPLRVKPHMAFSSQSPSAGSTVTVASPALGVSVDELYSGIVSASATLNRTAVPVTVTWPVGHWVVQRCDGYWAVADATVARVDISAALPDGVNTIAVTVRNADGFSDTTTWSFGTAVSPAVSSPAPAPDSDVATLTPTISALLADDDSEPEQVEVLLDGAEVAANVNINGLSVVAPKLKDDTMHTVSVSATLVPESRSCTANACHGAAAAQVPTCTSCHTDRAATHWQGRSLFDAVERASTRVTCLGMPGART